MDHPNNELDSLKTFGQPSPWNLKNIRWINKSRILRTEYQRRLPDLIRRPKIPPIRRAFTVIRILGITIVHWYLFQRKSKNSEKKLAFKVRVAAEKLGPTYIKLAQIISAGEGVFPAELVEECKKCRDQVPAEPFESVIRTLEESLGKPYSEVFSHIEEQPIAAASIAQVHAAKLLDGQTVVVKVQRTNIAKKVFEDIRVMSWIAPFMIGRIKVAALANPPALVELFAETISEELDFRIEASNMLDIATMLNDLERKEFIVPRPHPKFVYKKILVMEKLEGFKFSDVKSIKDAQIDTQEIIYAQMLGFLEGAFLHGLFHGDLHGGNLLIMENGQTALLDFGITGRLTEKQKIAFLKMLMSATSNDITGQVEALRDLGALPEDTDIQAVINDLGLDKPPIDPVDLQPEELVKELQGFLKALLSYGARLPKPLMLYVKNLIFIDGAIATLAPELDMFKIVTDVATHFASTHAQTITQQLGMSSDEWELDLEGVKAGFGVDPKKQTSLTYAELRERRELIKKRLGNSHIG